jgi:L-lactate dehydrogenase (cytochrome)
VRIVAPADYREAARRKLPRFLFDYIDGGAGSEATMRRNCSDLSQIEIPQRVLTGVSAVDLKTTWFGREQSLPIVLAPVGLTGMYARRGEVQGAQAAAGRGVPFCLSTVSVCGVDEVAAACPVPFWFQLYIMKDRGFICELLAAVRAAGCSALICTVDMPVPGIRYRDGHSGMSGRFAPIQRYLQALMHPRLAWDVGLRGRPHTLGNVAPLLGMQSGLQDFIGWLADNFDPTVNWRDVARLRSVWDGPLILKGILSAQDAQLAAEAGVDAIVVSNHGGRQLDGAISPARAMPRIRDQLGDRLIVLADSGVRSGADIVRLIGLGAHGVLIGRLWVYALAARGARGVTQLLDMLAKEMKITMTLAGVGSVAQLRASQLIHLGEIGP